MLPLPSSRDLLLAAAYELLIYTAHTALRLYILILAQGSQTFDPTCTVHFPATEFPPSLKTYAFINSESLVAP